MKPNLKIFIELLVAFFVFFLVNLIFAPDNVGFIGFEPNPLWIIVLAFALRYPRSQAMFAAFLVSILYAFLFYRSPQCTDLEELLQTKSLILIVSFNLLAFIISQKIAGLHSFIGYLKDSVHKKESQINELKDTVEMQERVSKETEVKLTGQVHTLSNLYTIAQSMESTDRKTIIHGLFDAMVSFIGAQQISIYREHASEFILEDSRGFLGKEIPQKLDISSGLPQMAIDRAETVWNRPDIIRDSNSSLDSNILCCGPVYLSDRSLSALVCIHEIPFIQFNRDNISFFEILLKWVGRSLDHSHDWDTQKKNAIYDSNFEVYRNFYLVRYLEMELANTYRYGGLFSLIQINLEVRGEANFNTIRILFALLIRKYLRTGDIIAEASKDFQYIIYLPSTNKAGAQTTLQKLVQVSNDFFLNNEKWSLKATGSYLESTGQEKSVQELFAKLAL